MDLPKKEATFDFEETGGTGKQYSGRFTVLCHLNMGQRYQLELEKSRLKADFQSPTDGLAGIAITLSKLRTHIVDAPEWWKQSLGGMMIDDEEILLKLYDKILEKEREWRESLKKKGEDAKKAQETLENQRSQ